MLKYWYWHWLAKTGIITALLIIFNVRQYQVYYEAITLNIVLFAKLNVCQFALCSNSLNLMELRIRYICDLIAKP